jgi:hypothetical protein
MSISVAVQQVSGVLEPPVSNLLDESAWQAWVAKGRAQDKRGSALGIGAVAWVSIAVLLAAAALWPQLTPYDLAVRFIISAGAIVLMVHEFRAGHGTFAAVFGALALIYNPVAPMFSISDGWQRAFVVASAAPFVVSLAWRRGRTAHND